MKAPLPPDETERLNALAEYKLLDTQFEQSYDDITALLSHICECPMALVVLVDKERQWFKSRIGFDEHETHRDQSFCAHAILHPKQTLVVPDTLADIRFADNPTVTAKDGIRFYAGVPLNTPSGFPLGTLCMADTKPRQLTPDQDRMLQTLARQVTTLFELRRTTMQLADALERVKSLETILPTCGHCKAVRDQEGNWRRIEEYLDTKVNVSMSHGVCPDCLRIHYPGYCLPKT